MPRENKKILVTRKLPEAVEARLNQDYDAILNDSDQPYSARDLMDLAQNVDALLPTVTDKLDKTVIEAFPERLKIIANFGVGFDHIDMEAAGRRGIVVTNTPGVLTDATAEITMLLLLGAARRAGEGHNIMKQKRWHGWTPTAMMGRGLNGAQLGILGMGRIGRALAKRARAFDMDIHYHNPRRLESDLEAGARYHDNIESLFGNSHFLSLNAAANDGTKRILNAQSLSLLPHGAVVVNTARGELVDDESLIAALKDGHVAAAGLDVYTGEPDIHPGYRTLDNVFLLPHLGSATVETRNAMGFKAADNLDSFFSCQEPPDRVA